MPPRAARRLLPGALLLALALAWATPRISPAILVEQTVAREALSSYTYGPEVTWTGTHFAVTWSDSRSGQSAEYAGLLELDAGVAQPGTHVLMNANDVMDDFNGFRGCARDGEAWFPYNDPWNGAHPLGILRTTPTLQRLGLYAWPHQGSVPPQVNCEGPRPLFLSNTNVYNPADYGLSLRLIEADGGLTTLDGGGPVTSRLQVFNGAWVEQSSAWDGQRWLVAFVDGRDRVPLPDGGAQDATDILGVFVDPAAGVSAPFPLSQEPEDEHGPTVVFDGTQYVLAWSVARAPGSSDVLLRTVGVEGSLGAIVPAATSAQDEVEPHLVATSGRVILAWLGRFSPTDAEVRALEVTGSVPGPSSRVSRGWYDALRAAAAPTGEVMLTVRDFGRGIRTVGLPLPPGLADAGTVDFASTAATQSQPRALPGANGMRVAWGQRGTVVGTRLDRDAGVLRASTLIAPGAYLLGLAGDGQHALASFGNGTFTRLDEDLQALDSPFPRWTVTPTSALGPPSWSGRGWSLGALQPEDGGHGLWVTRVDLDGGAEAPRYLGHFDAGYAGTQVLENLRGTVLGVVDHNYAVELTCQQPGFPERRYGLGTGAYTPWPRLATDGEDFLLVYAVTRGGGLAGLQGLFITGDCQADTLYHFVIADVPPALGEPPAVAWDGRRFLVAFVGGQDREGDILLTRVARDSGVAAPVVVMGEPRVAEASPAITSDAPGHWLVVGTRFQEDESFSARQVVARWGWDDFDGMPCALDVNCASGACRDGVCCAATCQTGPGGCAVCARALGAVADGVCTPRPAGAQCRAASTTCDAPEVCSGLATDCPPDDSDGGCPPLASDGGVDAGHPTAGVDGGDVSPLHLDATCQEAVLLPAGVEAARVTLLDAGVVPGEVDVDPVSGQARWVPPADFGETVLLSLGDGRVADVSVACGTSRHWLVGCGCGPGGAEPGRGLTLLFGLWAAAHSVRRRR